MHNEGELRPARVAVTRAATDASSLADALVEEGAIPVLLPLLRFEYLDDGELARRFASPEAGDTYEWLVCTSRHAVAACARAWAAGGGTAAIAGARVAAVGRATAEALRSLGVTPALVPATSNARHLAEALLAEGCGKGTRVLFPRAREARPELVEILRSHDVAVDDVICYDTIATPDGGAALARALIDGHVDVVTLASGSAARAFASTVSLEARRVARLVTIGTTTSTDARMCGLTVSGESPDATVEALARVAIRTAHESLSHA